MSSEGKLVETCLTEKDLHKTVHVTVLPSEGCYFNDYGYTSQNQCAHM